VKLKEDQIDLEFVSDLKFTEFCVMTLNYLKNLLSINEDIFFKIEISAREILNNAIIHGNKRDMSKRIYVKFKWGSSFLRIAVKDENSCMIDPKIIREKIENKNLLAHSGRGLLIVQNYMDRVEINPSTKGTEVIIEKGL